MNQPIDIGGNKQLLFDRRFIESSDGIELVMNPPVKCGTVLQSEKTWENYRVSFCSIVDAGNRYLLYYNALHADDSGRLSGNLCMAESNDGLTWTRPELNLFEFQGAKNNNIIGPYLAGAPCYDKNFPFGEPFLMIASVSGFLDPDGLKPPEEIADPQKITRMTDPVFGMTPNIPYLFTSPDGIRWSRKTGPVLDMACDNWSNQIFYDRRIGKYVAYLRGFNGKRTVVRHETDDPFVTPWVQRRPGAVPDGYGFTYIDGEMPAVMETDADDHWPGDVQNPSVYRYPWAQDAYFATPGLYRWYPGPGSRDDSPDAGARHRFRFFNDGPNDIHLFASRDGMYFDRPSRKPYIGLGLWGSEDGGSLFSGLGMLRSGDELWQYYSAFRITHGAIDANDRNVARICRSSQRLDGFVSADAGHDGGEFLTPVLLFEGDRLELNVDCGALGETRIGILDGNGWPIDGFGMDDCDPIDLNRIAAIVTWRGKASVSALRGKPVRLRFQMRLSKLFAFQFTDDRREANETK